MIDSKPQLNKVSLGKKFDIFLHGISRKTWNNCLGAFPPPQGPITLKCTIKDTNFELSLNQLAVEMLK